MYKGCVQSIGCSSYHGQSSLGLLQEWLRQQGDVYTLRDGHSAAIQIGDDHVQLQTHNHTKRVHKKHSGRIHKWWEPTQRQTTLSRQNLLITGRWLTKCMFHLQTGGRYPRSPDPDNCTRIDNMLCYDCTQRGMLLWWETMPPSAYGQTSWTDVFIILSSDFNKTAACYFLDIVMLIIVYWSNDLGKDCKEYLY